MQQSTDQSTIPSKRCCNKKHSKTNKTNESPKDKNQLFNPMPVYTGMFEVEFK